jgi:uncharacterized delta-60 repeat protein
MNRLGLRPLALVLAALWLAACGSAATLFDDIDQLVFPRPGSGDLDLSFGGGDGMVTTDLSSQDEAYAVGVQSDGKIVVAGYSNGDFVVLRYTSEGVLDTDFGGGDGIFTSELGGTDTARAVAIDSDDNIVVVGTVAYMGSSDIGVIRCTSDGDIDLSFNGTGKMVVDLGTSDYGGAVAIQADGMIVVAGGSDGDFIVLRFDDAGVLDNGFGTAGVARTDIGSGDMAKAVVIQPADQKIVAAGQFGSASGYGFAAVRYLATTGAPDNSFGTNGIAAINIVGVFDETANSAVIQADGKIVLGGHGDTATLFVLARLNTNGSLDTAFGTSGYVATDYQNSSVGEAVAIQSDGRILLAGSSYDGMNNKAAIVRYMPDGSLDSAFGICAFGDPTADFFGKALKIQDDGRLLVAGYAYSGGDYDIMLLRVLP